MRKKRERDRENIETTVTNNKIVHIIVANFCIKVIIYLFFHQENGATNQTITYLSSVKR